MMEGMLLKGGCETLAPASFPLCFSGYIVSSFVFPYSSTMMGCLGTGLNKSGVPIQWWRDSSTARSLNDSLYRQMVYATTMGSCHRDTWHLEHDIDQQKPEKGGNAI